MTFDINKPYRTRDGRRAWAAVSPETYCIGSAWFSLIGWIESGDRRDVGYWTIAGRDAYSHSDCDLVNIPEKRTDKVWINVYERNRQNVLHWSRALADHHADDDRIACIEREITYEVGEGLP